jgi:peptide/nickel transport system permease protein
VRAFIIRRILLAIPTVLLATFVVFMMVRFIPGDVIDAILGQQVWYHPDLDRPKLEARLGLDVSLFHQYGRWLGVVPQADGKVRGLLQGDLGDTLWTRTPVIDDIWARWPITLELGILAFLIGQIIALPVGIYSALRQDTWGDYLGRSLAILLISLPYFWVGTLIIVLPSIWWGYMPSIMYIPFLEDPIGNLKMFIMPAIVLGMTLSGTNMRLTRAMMLEVMRQDYIRTAWAKGLKERVVVIRHALKNVLISIITLIGLQMPLLVAGSVIVEKIFALPGMGQLLISNILQRDYPVVSGVLIFVAVIMVLVNLVVDLTYGYLDPRIRYR